MSAKFDYYIGLDIGLKGGIAILKKNKLIDLYDIPTKKIIINKKKKNTYDIDKIIDILCSYADKKVCFAQEAVSAFTGQGVTSSFNFGKSSGLTIGIAMAYGWEVVEIYPKTWKKFFPELKSSFFNDLKEQQKKIRADIKILEIDLKNIKDKSLKKPKKEEIKQLNSKVDKLGREAKKEAKVQSRELCKQLYPKNSDRFSETSDDGKSDAVLIALAVQKNIKGDKNGMV